MLSALSRFIGINQDDSHSSAQNRVVALQGQIQDLEEGETPMGISRSTNRRTGLSATIGAAGGGLGGYLLSTFTVAVATVAAPITVVAVGAAAGATTLAVVYRMYRMSTRNVKRNNQQLVNNINNLSKDLVESKIKALAEAKAGATIDLVLNRLSEVEEQTTLDSEKKPVGLVKLNKLLVKELLSSLKRISKFKPPVVIKKIDISSAGLTKRDITNLLKAGLGSHETEHLILSNDKHSAEMINLLRAYIVEKKSAFQKLKVLDLSGNAIDAACVNGIRDIVNHLRLKELILADNPDLSGNILDKMPLSVILTEPSDRLVSLRKLNLANTGLVEENAADIAKFIKNAVFLEEINIDRNEGLTLEDVETYVKEKGGVKSISLKRINCEYDEHLSMEEVFAERDDVLGKIATSKKANEPWPIFLLNYKLAHKFFPIEVAKYLESTVFNKTKIDELIQKIQIERSAHLGVNIKSIAPITESELIACYEKKLPELYQKVKDKIGESLVDAKLISQMSESKLNQSKSKPTLKDLSVGKMPRTKTKAIPTTSPKPFKPVAKSATPIKTPSAPITTQYNSARTSKLNAEINAILGADELARNPGLVIPTPRV